MVAVSIIVPSLAAAPGAGAVGYSATNAFPTVKDYPGGIAINQSNGTVYVADSSTGSSQISTFDSEGVPGISFGSNPGGFTPGVAVRQSNGNVYAFELAGEAIVPQLNAYSAAGAPLGGVFPKEVSLPSFESPLPQIAIDGSGNIYYPNTSEGKVEVYNATAELQGTVFDCSGCPTPESLSGPTSVAVDATGNVYVADRGNDRVVKFSSSGAFLSVLQSGKGAVSVAVDPSSGDVFVGAAPGGTEFHVMAYDAAGAPVADFGKGLIGDPDFPLFVSQIAVNGATGDVYVTDISGANVGLVAVFSPVSSPVTTTGTASVIAQSTATLNGTVNPEGVEVDDCHFVYGTTESYGSEAPCLPAEVGSGEEAVAVHADISGLSPKQGYHFKLVAEGAGGVAEGDDKTFTTLPNKPTVSGESATGITQHGATLTGKINPNGTGTTCEFEYGTTMSYGTKVPCTANPGSGEVSVEVSIAALSGLVAGTTYHYRINATNAGGTTNGGDKTFATLADTCQTNAALCPPPPVPPAPTPPATTPPAKKPLKCKKGFKKKTVKGKQKCVKVKKKHKKN